MVIISFLAFLQDPQATHLLAQDIHFKTMAQFDEAVHSAVNEVFVRLPISFESNEGQLNEEVKCLSWGRGYDFFLPPSEAILSLPPGGNDGQNIQNSNNSQLRLKLVGASQRQWLRVWICSGRRS